MPQAVTFGINSNPQSFLRGVHRAGQEARRFGHTMQQTKRSMVLTSGAFRAIGRRALSLVGSLSRLQSNMLGVMTVSKSLGAIKKTTVDFASFEEGMLKTMAVTGMTAGEMVKFRKVVENLTIKTKFSAEEVLNAAFALATLGTKKEDILQMLPAITDVSIALGSDVTSAAETAISIMKQFKIPTSEVTKATDLMANAYTKSALNLERFSAAMQYAGPAAAAFSQDIHDTVAIVAALADRGLNASMAGTQLRMVFAQLTKQNSKGESILKKYGLSMKDVASTSNNLIDSLGKMEKAGMSADAIIAIFGKRAGPLVKMLLDLGDANESAADKLRKLSKEMRASGTSSRVAGRMQQGFSFALKQASAGASLLSIAIGEAVVDAFDLTRITVKLAERMGQLAQIVKALDFDVLKQAGIKIFDPREIMTAMHTAFSNLLPATMKYFQLAAISGGLSLLEVIVKKLPEITSIVQKLLINAMFYGFSTGAKLMVIILTKGFADLTKALYYVFDKLFAKIQILIGGIMEEIPTFGKEGKAMREAGETRMGKTWKEYEKDTKDISDFASRTQEGALEALNKVTKELAPALQKMVDKAVTSESFRTQSKEMAGKLAEVRRHLDTTQAKKEFLEALAKTPTAKQRKGAAEILQETARAKGVALTPPIKKTAVQKAIEQKTSALETPQLKKADETARVIDAPALTRLEEKMEALNQEFRQLLRPLPSIADNSINHNYRNPNRREMLTQQSRARTPRGDRK